MKCEIVLLQGDGIGPCLCAHSEKLLAAFGARFGLEVVVHTMPFGKKSLSREGSILPARTVQAVLASDGTILFGVDSIQMPASPVGLLRRTLDLSVEIREVRTLPGSWCYRPDLDLAFVREISQGFLSDRNLYAGSGEWMTDADTAMSLRVITYAASKRASERAFSYAAHRGQQRVTAVHKAAIFKKTCGTFLRACRDTAARWPDIAYEEMAADDVAGALISAPQKFGVLVTTNLFGDLLSDEGAALVSGRCVGANYGPHARVYMPVHHDAEYAALTVDSFDPVPGLLCLVALLRDAGAPEAATLLQDEILACAVDPNLKGCALLDALQHRFAG